MKILVATTLAVAFSLGAMLNAAPAQAAGQYPIKIEAKDAVSVTAFSPTNQAIRMTISQQAGTTKSYALESTDRYEFRITVCGKTHTAYWNRGGTGVTIVIGCDLTSFTMQR